MLIMVVRSTLSVSAGAPPPSVSAGLAPVRASSSTFKTTSAVETTAGTSSIACKTTSPSSVVAWLPAESSAIMGILLIRAGVSSLSPN